MVVEERGAFVHKNPDKRVNNLIIFSIFDNIKKGQQS